MHMHKATRISVTTTRLIETGIEELLEEEGAAGFFVFEGRGKGQHEQAVRQRSPLVDDFGIIKIEAVVMERAVAEAIAEKIARRFFEEHSGIVYLDNVDVLRPEKFVPAE